MAVVGAGIGAALVLSVFSVLLFFVLIQWLTFRKKGINVFGRETIERKAYFLGKASSVLCWAAMVVQALGIDLRWALIPGYLETVSLGLLLLGFVLMFAGYFDLGESFRFGMPEEEIKLKTTGVYGLSRNPTILGFYITYLASALYTQNPVVLVLAGIAGFIHHKIALGEAEYLKKVFGREYRAYSKKAPFYI